MTSRSALAHIALAAVYMIVLFPTVSRAQNALPSVRIVVVGNGSPGPYALGRPFIGNTAAVTDYGPPGLAIASESPATGAVTFTHPLAQGDSVAVTLAVPPDWMQPSYHRPPDTTDTSERSTPSPGTLGIHPTPQPSGGTVSGLTFGGSKTFEVNAGSVGEAALNQSLRLSISGHLTDDITLNAAISDQNVPISPEGSTRELEELDRVLIEVRGKRFSADMGDLDLTRNDGRWLAYSRRLSGARIDIRRDRFSTFGVGAASEGYRRSITILPIEGNQGPYRLTAQDGSGDISIIPGTELVWINGERLTRGSSDDYIIEYTTGELTFTSRRIIGADLRIVVDYEYTSERYLRNFYAGGGSASLLGNRLKFTITAARESDNPDRAVRAELDAEMRKALKTAGDTPVVMSGISPAQNDSSGSYDRVGDILVYNPAGAGALSAVFSWVGETTGSYRYQGGGIYAWVPPAERLPGSGASYEPVTIVEGPQSHDVAGVALSFDPIPSIHIEGEASASAVDKNTLSSRDDGDNGGMARRIGVTFHPVIEGPLPLAFTLSGGYRTQEERFSSLDRDRAVEENRAWGLPLLTARHGETVTEFASGVSLNRGRFTGTGVTATGGAIDLTDGGESQRTGLAAHIAHDTRGNADFALDRITRSGLSTLPDEDIGRITVTALGKAAGFTPEVRYESERAEGTGTGTHGTAYRDIALKLATPRIKGISGNLDWYGRDEEAKHGAWADSARVRGGGIGIDAGDRASRSLSARYAHRERTASGNRAVTDQASLDYLLTPSGASWRIEGSYRAGRAQEAVRRKVYLYAGSGRGAYRWEDANNDGIRDEEEFIPDEHGTYYLYEETLADYRPVNTVSTYGRVGFDIPSSLIARFTGRSLDIRTETSFDITEQSTAPAADVFLLNLGKFRTSGRTTSGESRLQEEVTVPFADTGGSARFRYFRRDTYSALYVTGAERTGQEEYSLRFRVPLHDHWDTETTITRSRSSRTMDERSSGDFKVTALTGDMGLSWYPLPPAVVGLQAGLGRDTDSIGGATARYWHLRPSFTWRFSGAGRIEASYRYTGVALESGGSSRIPYTMARGQKSGDNHDLSIVCDYRLSQRMTILASYTGRRFGGEEFEHFARAQVRALF